MTLPNEINHDSVSIGSEWVATSAGTFNLRTLKAEGRSESLDLDPSEGDSEILRKFVSNDDFCRLHLDENLFDNLKRLDYILAGQRIKNFSENPNLSHCQDKTLYNQGFDSR